MSIAKSFEIPKQLVWDAYLRVKANAGAAGVDEQSVEEFEQDLKNNLYRIWNRMSSGTYFPPPVLRVEIPKRDGGLRPLGIPTVGDRIAQTVVKLYFEPAVEPRFHPDSYGYRPRKSAHDALATTRQRCWKFDWVLDLDIKAFFDSLDHDLMMRAVRKYTSCRWVLLYVERWLRASVKMPSGDLVARDTGTPQGGVISPLLANIFLHLAFDQWMQSRHPQNPFERYADDIVVHCRSLTAAEDLQRAIEQRLALCKLELNQQKTRIVYCKDANRSGRHTQESFDFLGYTFQPRRVQSKTGERFISFSPGISRAAAKRIRQTMRHDWVIPDRTDKTLTDLANMFNPIIRGWIAYYGAFRRSALTRVFRALEWSLGTWVMRKYKRFHARRTRAAKWLDDAVRRQPRLFAHWAIMRPAAMTRR